MKTCLKGFVVLNFITLCASGQQMEAQMPDPPFTNVNQELGSCVRLQGPAGDLFAGYFPSVSPNAQNFHLTEIALPPPFGTGGTNYRVFQVLVGSSNCNMPLTQLNNGAGISAIEVDPATPGASLGQLAVTGASKEGVWFGVIDRMVCWTPFPSKMYFPFPGSSPVAPSKPLIVQESGAFNYFICGQFDKFLYIIKINQSGTVIWSRCYSDPTINPGDLVPNGIIIDPYSIGDVVIVGKIATPAGGSEGFLMKVDGALGNINFMNTYGQPIGNAHDAFNSVSVASFVGISNPQGYIIGGESGIAPNPLLASPVIMKLDQLGNITWCKAIQSSADPLANGLLSVLERQNAFASRVEYYGVLRSKAGTIVTKFDDAGDPINMLFPSESSEFPFNVGSSQVSKPIGITIDNGLLSSATTGIHAFGSLHTLTTNNIHYVSSFFNGITGCTAPTNLQGAMPLNCITNPVILMNANALVACSLINIVNTGNGWGWNACLGSTSSGSNMRPIHNSKGERLSDEEIESGLLENQYEVYPNPASREIEISSSNQNQMLHLKIMDITGKLVFSADLNTNDSKTIDISSLKASLYLIEIENESGQIIRKKLVKE